MSPSPRCARARARTARMHPTRVVIGAAVAVGLTLALTGCLSADPVPVVGGAKPVVSASDVPLPAASVTPSVKPVPTITAIPTGLTCNDVLDPNDLYSLKGGANLSLDPTAKPGSGSMAARLVALKGISCVYVNNSSGENFTVGVARITTGTMSLAKAAIASEQGARYRVAAYSGLPNTVGYFRVYNGIGLVSVATSTFWFSVSSDTFASSIDAKQIVLRIEKSLGK